MDIKPVKKKRRKINPSAVNASVAGQKNITLKTRPKNQKEAKKPKAKTERNLINFLSKRIFYVSGLALLCLLYLPASKLLDISGQREYLLSESSSMGVILNNISYMPQKIFLNITQSTWFAGEAALKAYAFVFILATVYLFYLACLRWLDRSTALITTFLFASSSWLILSSQNLEFNSIYLIFLPLVITLNYLLSTREAILKVILAAILFSIILYSPGMIWIVLGYIIFLPLFMQKMISRYETLNISALLTTVFIMILPLLIILVFRTGNLSEVLTGGSNVTAALLAGNLKETIQTLFHAGLNDSNLWLVGSPVVNYIVWLLALFGVVHLIIGKSFRQHSIFLAITVIFSLLVVILTGVKALSLLIPAIYLAAGFGIKFLLGRWYVIFPNNPIARNLGLGMIIFITLLASGYEVTRYYLVWPETNDHISVMDTEQQT